MSCYICSALECLIAFKQEISLFFSILLFMSSRNFMISSVKHETSLTTTRPQGYLTLLCSTQLSMKFIMLIMSKCQQLLAIYHLLAIMLINVKMSTIVDISAFNSMMNTASESLKEFKVSIFQHFRFYGQLKCRLTIRLSMKKVFLGLGPVPLS